MWHLIRKPVYSLMYPAKYKNEYVVKVNFHCTTHACWQLYKSCYYYMKYSLVWSCIVVESGIFFISKGCRHWKQLTKYVPAEYTLATDITSPGSTRNTICPGCGLYIVFKDFFFKFITRKLAQKDDERTKCISLSRQELRQKQNPKDNTDICNWTFLDSVLWRIDYT